MGSLAVSVGITSQFTEAANTDNCQAGRDALSRLHSPLRLKRSDSTKSSAVRILARGLALAEAPLEEGGRVNYIQDAAVKSKL